MSRAGVNAVIIPAVDSGIAKRDRNNQWGKRQCGRRCWWLQERHVQQIVLLTVAGNGFIAERVAWILSPDAGLIAGSFPRRRLCDQYLAVSFTFSPICTPKIFSIYYKTTLSKDFFIFPGIFDYFQKWLFSSRIADCWVRQYSPQPFTKRIFYKCSFHWFGVQLNVTIDGFCICLVFSLDLL